MRIKSSKRGLTFSFQEKESFHAGSRYRYYLDVKQNEIIREDVRKLLANMVHQHKEKNPDGYCRGTECAEEVNLYKGYALQSYAEYDSCKVTFTALKYASVCHILDDGTIR